MEEYKILKRKYGEAFAKFCRQNFPTILEEDGRLSEILESRFTPSHYLFEDIVSQSKEANFKDYIMWLFLQNEEDKSGAHEFIDVPPTPEELMAKAGYDLFQCETNGDVLSFKKYWRQDEALCTFNDPSRIQHYNIFFAVKKGATEIKPSENPKRQDKYGTSVISLQFQKGPTNFLSIKNRYNHSVENHDATFSNNLENIIPGLTESFEFHYGFNLESQNKFQLENYILANDGKFYRYNYELNNIYYCAENVAILNSRPRQRDKSRFIMMDFWVFDTKQKVMLTALGYSGDSPLDNEKIVEMDVKNAGQKGSRIVSIKTESGNLIKFVVNEKGQMIGYYDEREEVPAKLFERNCYLECIAFPNAKILGKSNFKETPNLTKLYAPNLEKIEKSCFKKTKLEHLDLPKLVELGQLSFSVANSLQTINLPSLKSMYKMCFEKTKALKSINMPEVKLIGGGCFEVAPEVKNLSLENLESLWGGSFGKMINLETLNLPNLRGMGYECFSGSVKLEKVFLPELEGMGERSFNNCPSIKEIDLPKLKRMRSYCFYDSGKIEKINMPPLDIKGRKCFRRYHLNTLHKTYLSKKHRKRNPVPQCFRP